MPVLLHDYSATTHLPVELREHVSGVCLRRKSVDRNRRCGEYCGASGTVDSIIHRYPDGYVHRCPFGYWKIAVPLQRESILQGILFAGPCTVGGSGDGVQLAAAPDEEWLEHCRVALTAIGARVEQLILPAEWSGGDIDRRRQVLDYLNHRYDRPARLPELARRLNLSPSRARHLVVELFGKPFSALGLEIRLKRAASYLELTDLSLSDIALRLGFCDASHFSNSFRSRFGVTPREFRKKTRGG
jgi:AraC-like DNA-binding protein